MKPIMVLLLSSLLLTGGSATAQSDPFKALIAARSLKCQFGPGSFGKWSDSQVSVVNERMDSSLHFDSIDLKAGKARLVGNRGAADLIVWGTASGITFVEQTGVGNVVFSTVFPERIPGTDEFYAVMSRHMAMLSPPPLASQYHGSCKVWQ